MAKDTLDKVTDTIKRAADDTRDAVHEGGHRIAADAEKARREDTGDTLSASEKAKSVVNEATHRTQAEIDAAKRKIRDKT
ncbi:MAG: hypothetical protein WAL67_05355 [Candidatus Cybelea sp.]